MVIHYVFTILAVVIDSDWLTLIVMYGGTLLALEGGALSRCREEEWASRPTAEDVLHVKEIPSPQF